MVHDRGDDDGRHSAATAAALTAMLESPRYAPLWRAHVTRQRSGQLHQGAVAEVLAEHLWDTGQNSDTDTALPRRLKDTVSRALTGRSLPTRVLQLFIDAFAIDALDAARLWALRTGGNPLRVVILGTRELDNVRVESIRAQDYRTVALHEIHEIGADGLPASHRTVQVIRAVTQVTAYDYCFDTDAAAVEMVRGGTAGPLHATELPGIFASTITLTTSVEPGQTGSLEYRTIFAYRHPVPREFRRGARRPIDNVDLLLLFHPLALPNRIWWAVWDALHDPQPSFEERVELDSDHSVHRFVDHLAGGLVGFHWD